LNGTEPPPCDEHRGVVDHVIGGWNRLRDWLRGARARVAAGSRSKTRLR
jgi:hypothetical protein